MGFKFNEHRELNNRHATFSPSQPAWLNYDDDKLCESYVNRKAAERGTKLHAWAKETIDLGILQARSKRTLCAYVNDAIGFQMSTEVPLKYSDDIFGHADAVSFDERRNILRVHDLKTGVIPAAMTQLEVYAAIFCLEYNMDPFHIKIELRIYQNDEVKIERPEPEYIADLMDKIVHKDNVIWQFLNGGER